jgi:hypothetical protein
MKPDEALRNLDLKRDMIEREGDKIQSPLSLP